MVIWISYVIFPDLFVIHHLLLLLFALGMSTMKENKGKDVMGEGSRLETQSQARPSVRDKRKSLPKNLDLGNLPSWQGKKAKHGSSQTVKPNLPPSQPSVKIFDVDSSTPIETTLSKTPLPKMTVPVTSQPSQWVPSNIIENEDLAWERFQKAISDKDINTCYDMSLKKFEHSGVHDLFKVCNHIFSSSLLKDIYIYYLTFIHF